MKRLFLKLLVYVELANLAVLLVTPLPGKAATHLIAWGENAYFQTNTVPAGLTNVIAVTGGDSHMLALLADGTVVAWGLDDYGQTNVPPDTTNVVQIAAGSTHSLALLSDGSVRFWGDIYSTGVSNAPPAALANMAALALGPGAQHVLELRPDGTVLDWGGSDLPIPPYVTNILNVKAGSYHALALRADGKVLGWGSDAGGSILPPSSATNVIAISSGFNHDLALRADGSLVTWGLNYDQVLNPPSGATNIVAIACGGNYSMALRADGKLLAWGDNSYGQTNIPPGLTNIVAIAGTSYGGLALTADDGPPLVGLLGDQTVEYGATARMDATAISTTPLRYQWLCDSTNLPGATNATLVLTNVQFSQTGSYAMLVTNIHGAVTSSPSILTVAPLVIISPPLSQTGLIASNVTFAVSGAGQGMFTYQWQFDGTNITGATNSSLVLTNLTFDDAGSYSVAVSNSLGGVASSPALLNIVPMIVTAPPQNQSSFPGGTVTLSIGLQTDISQNYQWQFNGTNLPGATAPSLTLANLLYSQAGSYSVIVSNAWEIVTNKANLVVSPVAAWGYNAYSLLNVPDGLTNVAMVAAGEYHSLALGRDGTVVGWGDNDYGQVNIPPDLSHLVTVAGGGHFSLALRNDGTVAAWGNNGSGQTNVPADLSNIIAISAGFAHCLALKKDGTVIAWGLDADGQTNVPASLSNVVAISTGGYFSLALKSNGTVIGWGDNTYGQTNIPPDLTNVVAVAAGVYHALALRSDGTVAAWGNNDSGQTAVPTMLSNVVAIAAGSYDSYALTDQGAVVAWGDSGFGATNPPVGLNAVGISAGYDFAVAIVGNGQHNFLDSLLNPSCSAEGFSVSLQSQSGHVYRLEFKNALSDASWTPLQLVAGNGGMLTLTNSTTTPRRFYRLRQW